MQTMNWRKKVSTLAALAAPLVLSASIGGATLGVSSTAQAQEAPPAAGSTPDDEELAKKVLGVIREANAAYDAENYAEASKKYEEAYDLYPDPAILVRLGKTAEQMNKKNEALDHYKEFVRLLPDDPTSAELKTKIAELENAETVELSVVSEPAGATVFIDANAEPVAEPTPTTLELEPGQYKLRIDKEGFESKTESVEVVADTEQEVSVTLRRQMLTEVTPANFATDSASDSDSARLDIYGWSTLGLGVATLATSGVFYFMATEDENDVNDYDKRAAGASPQDLQDLKDSANTNYDVSTITAIAGGVLSAVGVGLLSYHYLSGDTQDEEVDSPSVAWGIDAAGDSTSAWIGVDGSF